VKLTAPFPVSDQPVGEKSILSWINGEAQKVLRQLRTFANFLGWERKEAVTAGAGAYVTVWTSTALPTNGTWNVSANVTGVTISGTAQRAGYVLHGTFEATAGVVAQVGSTTTAHSAESAANCNARFGVDTTNRTVYVEARDDGASPMRYVAVVAVNEAVPK